MNRDAGLAISAVAWQSPHTTTLSFTQCFKNLDVFGVALNIVSFFCYLRGSVERSRPEQHFCSLLPYFFLSWYQLFQLCLSFWTLSYHLVLLKPAGGDPGLDHLQWYFLTVCVSLSGLGQSETHEKLSMRQMCDSSNERRWKVIPSLMPFGAARAAAQLTAAD